VLDRLVEADLLARRTLDGQVAYRLANESVAETITQLAGPEVRRQQAVERELDHAWFAWLARDALASRSQLRYVAASPPPALPPVRALLLLRAATSKNEPASPWLDALRTEQGRALVLGVEQPDSAPAGPSRSELRHAGQLLAPETPPPANSQFGPVTWTAASHPERATRETAALALAAAEPEAGVNRIGTALRALPSFPLRHWRRAELLGALADADAGTTPDQPATTRVLTWLWRVRRRLIGDRYEVGRLGAGAMLGAGVSLALLRIATGVVEGWRLAIMVSSVYLYFAALLGLGLAVGMATADALLLGRWKETSNRASPLLAIALGGGGFGLAHMLVALINGLRFEDDWLVAPLGFVAGVGLAVAVYPWYRTGRRGSPLMWLLRIALGSATLTLTQMAFNSVEGGGVSLAFITFRGYPESLLSLGRNNLRLLDSALTGAVLVLGSGLGLLLGARWIERWRRLTDLPGE
jgi:hypothetical protein